MSIKKQDETSGELIIKSLSQGKNGKTKIVFKDGKEGVITDSAYLSSFLYPGKKLSQEEWAKLSGINKEDKVRKYVDSLLSKRLYSPLQLIDKLVKVKKMTFEESSNLIDRLIDEGVVSPSSYAEDRIESLKMKGFSKEAIKEDLRREKISEDLIYKLDDKLNSDNEEIVLRLLNEEVRKHPRDSFRILKMKLESFLSKKGYGGSESERLISSMSLDNPSFSSDKREKDALLKAARVAYDRIKRSKKDSFQKKLSFVKSLISKGFSRDDIEEVIKEEEYDFG